MKATVIEIISRTLFVNKYSQKLRKSRKKTVTLVMTNCPFTSRSNAMHLVQTRLWPWLHLHSRPYVPKLKLQSVLLHLGKKDKNRTQNRTRIVKNCNYIRKTLE